ncbi:hypothetical protein BH23VER1_BH23VER1_01130 [soil metagenome]
MDAEHVAKNLGFVEQIFSLIRVSSASIRGLIPSVSPASLSPICALSALSAALAVGVAGCRSGAGPADEPVPIAVQFTGDVDGRLEPCGCFTGQYGGLSRLKAAFAMLAENDQSGAVPLRFDVGDALAGTRDFELIQHRYLARAFADLGFEALNLGHRETELSAAALRGLIGASPVPFVGANVLDRATGQPIAAPFVTVQRGGLTIGVVGVADPAGRAERSGEGIEIADMVTTLTNLLPEVAAATDLIVLLAFTDVAQMRALADAFYEIDLILGGDVREPAREVLVQNRSLISYTTNEARALGLVNATFDRKTRHLTDPSGAAMLLEDRIPQAPETVALADAYRTEIARTDLAIDHPGTTDSGTVPGVAPGATFVGSESCAGCHPTATAAWQKSGHAHAFATLERRGAAADPNCIGCHTVGFGTESGYRRAFQGERLADVGCESCHGPGSEHVRQRAGGGTVSFQFPPLGAGDCTTCHYGEFSRPFVWDDFWELVQHGKEPTT